MTSNPVGKITHMSNQHFPLFGNPSAQKGCGHVFVLCLSLHPSLTLREESADHQHTMRQRLRSWPWNCLLNSDRLQHIPFRSDKERFMQAHICTWLGTVMSCSWLAINFSEVGEPTVADLCRTACVVSTAPNSMCSNEIQPCRSAGPCYFLLCFCCLHSASSMIFQSLFKVSVQGQLGQGLKPPGCGRSLPTQTIL